MKINDAGRIGAIQQYRKSHSGGLDKAGKAQAKDEVRISSQAKELHGTQHAERSDKIESLKQAVSTGTYHVEANKIAEKLLPYIY